MKILHLYANHKWTGPAELALQAVRGLVREGVDAELALAGFVHEGMEHAIEARAREASIPVRTGLDLRRHFHWRSFRRDARTLATWIDGGSVDLLHTHQPGDHLVAALALRRAKRRVPLVRSLWDGVAPRRSLRTFLSFRRTDAITVPIAGVATGLSRRFSIEESRVRRVAGPLADEFFDPALERVREDSRRRLRTELGIADDVRLVGITARIQARRRWDVLWDFVGELPRDAHLCVLGRPDEGVFEELCAAPLRARGLEDRVHFLGYRADAAYRHAVVAFDAFVFLVPGSDATCRALREAMALAVPVVTTDLGLLPRIVDDGETGLVRPADSAALAASVHEVLENREQAVRLGARAQRVARDEWTGRATARDLAALYAELGGA